MANHKSLIFLSVLSLGACAYAIDDQIQDVRIETPGAINAKCHVYIDKIDYTAYPPQTLKVVRSKNDMIVDCLAPGNRRKKAVIEAGYEGSTAWNVLNGGAGAPLDYVTGSMFEYPDIIEVNFTDTPVRDQPLPAQNNPDLRPPEDYPLEEFRPSRPRMNSDGTREPAALMRRGEGASAWGDDATVAPDETSGFTEPAVMDGDKGDLQTVIDKLAPPTSAPVPLEPPAAVAPPPPAPTSLPAPAPLPPPVSGPKFGPPVPLVPGE